MWLRSASTVSCSLALLCALPFLSSCTTSPVMPPTPALPFGEFIEQVLDPLAGKIANERIEHAQTELKAGQISPALLTLLGSVGSAIHPGIAAASAGVAGLNNAAIEQQSARLDTLRYPLKKELLALYTKRTFQDDDTYRVCVDGAERRYGVQDLKFMRLADGPGPCELTPLKTLTKGGTD